jgi:hypothetical protein
MAGGNECKNGRRAPSFRQERSEIDSNATPSWSQRGVRVAAMDFADDMNDE